MNERVIQFINEQNVALDVTDEEYAEICKVCPPSENKEHVGVKAERLLEICAYILFVLGIIAVSVLLFALFEEEFELFFVGLGILFSSVMTAAISLVIVNISRKLNR